MYSHYVSLIPIRLSWKNSKTGNWASHFWKKIQRKSKKSNFENVWDYQTGSVTLIIFDTTVASHFASLTKSDRNSDTGQDYSYTFESGEMKTQRLDILLDHGIISEKVFFWVLKLSKWDATITRDNRDETVKFDKKFWYWSTL